MSIYLKTTRNSTVLNKIYKVTKSACFSLTISITKHYSTRKRQCMGLDKNYLNSSADFISTI